MAGIGILIRYSKGEVIATLSKKTSLPRTIEDIEALAFRKATSFAHEVGLRDMVINGTLKLSSNTSALNRIVWHLLAI